MDATIYAYGKRYGPRGLEEFWCCETVGELADSIAQSLGYVRAHTLVSEDGFMLARGDSPPLQGLYVVYPL